MLSTMQSAVWSSLVAYYCGKHLKSRKQPENNLPVFLDKYAPEKPIPLVGHGEGITGWATVSNFQGQADGRS